MPALDLTQRIYNEKNRIFQYFTEIDGNQRAIITPLIQNAAFMKVTLENLQERINAEGVTDTYQNGANQSGVKQSASLQSYNALIKNYASVIKTLSQLLPPEVKQSVIQSVQPRQKTEEELRAEQEAREAEAEYWSQAAKRLLETGEY